jgi:RNA polymerase sigma-70 factor (ECF subfamily)
MEAHSEMEIIARVQAGHAGDFGELVRRYQGPLFRIVGNLVERSMVEDLVQDIFLTVYASIGDFDTRRGTFRSWIYRIARNHALNARKKKREKLMDEMPDLADARTPCQALLTKEVFACMDRALNGLKFRDRVIFVLAELEGLSYAEIAHIEKLALGTVKSRLSRIKNKLRGAMAPYVSSS